MLPILINDNIELPGLYYELYRNLVTGLRDSSEATGDKIQKINQSIQLIQSALEGLKLLVIENAFIDLKEEILFFKIIKPKFSSLLIFYSKIYRLEIYRPLGSKKEQEIFFNAELNGIDQFLKTEAAFYAYYRSGSTTLDDVLFSRSGSQDQIYFDEFIVCADKSFSTARDNTVARILAYEMLSEYCNAELRMLKGEEHLISKNEPNYTILRWTAPKVALIELIYALHSSGVYNNGNTDLKRIASSFERFFHVDLGNFFNTFQEIRIRKKNRTVFVDQLKETLLKRMEAADDRQT